MAIVVALGIPHAHARGTAPEYPVPFFNELRDEGVKIVWRGRTACCDTWLLTTKNDEVMWLSTQKKSIDAEFLDMDGKVMTPEAIRKRLKLDEK